jgi:hypothetical protein
MTTDNSDSRADRESENDTTAKDKSTVEEPRKFISFGSYKSTDPKNPDIIEVVTEEKDTFETEFSTCVNVRDKDAKPRILPLKSHNSPNISLWKQWISAANSGRIKKGKKVIIKTWLDTSKNGYPIRRYRLVV